MSRIFYIALFLTFGCSDSGVLKVTCPDCSFIELTAPLAIQIGKDFAENDSRVISTAGDEAVYEIVSDSSSNYIIAGTTTGSLFSTNLSLGTIDCFILKISSTGSLLWGKQFGGAGTDECRSITVDDNDNIYLAGQTTASLFDTLSGGEDVFFIKLSTDGDILWSKQLGTAATSSAFINSTSGLDRLPYCLSLTDHILCAIYTTSNIAAAPGGSDLVWFKMNHSDGDITFSDQLVSGKVGENATVNDSSGAEGLFGIKRIDDRIFILGFTTGDIIETHLGGGGSLDPMIIELNTNAALVDIDHIAQEREISANVMDTSDTDIAVDIIKTAQDKLIWLGLTSGSLFDNTAGGFDYIYSGYKGESVFPYEQLGANYIPVSSGAPSFTGNEGTGTFLNIGDEIYLFGAADDDLFFARFDLLMNDVQWKILNASNYQLSETYNDFSLNEGFGKATSSPFNRIVFTADTLSNIMDDAQGSRDIIILRVDQNFNF